MKKSISIAAIVIFFLTPLFSFSQISEGRYNIRLANGRFLEAEGNTYKNNGCKVQTWLPVYTLNQLWEVKRVPGTTNKYYFFNIGANKVLDADAGTVNNNGCKVQLWEQIPVNINQQWILQSATGGKYTIRNAASSGDKVLNIAGGVLDRGGVAVELSDNRNNDGQKWSFVRSYDSAFVSQNRVDLRLNQSSLKTQRPDGIDRGFCTFFGNLAALEAAYKKRGYGELDLSEEYFSIVAKTNWLHGRWIDITSSNFPENQLGGLQGGGQVQLLTKGIKIPLERDVPYKVSYTLPPLPNPLTQKAVNDINAGIITTEVTNASQYYGATAGYVFPGASLTDMAAYERVLDLGFEIDVDIRPAHNNLLVGYDKTNPAAPYFLVKDSYARPPGSRCVDRENGCTTISYTDLAEIIVAAAYITDVSIPSSFPQIKYLGRWFLLFDGHMGILDINHIPGMNQVPLTVNGAGPEITDRRLGSFTDANGRVYRVNGSINNNSIEFYFDIGTPNLRWDEIRGRKFNYNLNSSGNLMTGFHRDVDGKKFGGYANRLNYVQHNHNAENTLVSLRNTEWVLQLGNITGTLRFSNEGNETRVGGNFISTGRPSIPFSLEKSESSDPPWLTFRMGTFIAVGTFMNHEKGIICGNEVSGQGVFMLYKR